MTIYNFNLGIGWASSGVEYAQAYRANVFRKNNQKAKFIFTDNFHENIQPMTENIGFDDEEVIWLYQYFTDVKISPTTFSIQEFEKQFTISPTFIRTTNSTISYIFEENALTITAYLDRENKDFVYKTEKVVKGKLIQRDYYSYVKVFSEYFKPVGNQSNLYQRRFFNEDGSTAYDELLNGKESMFVFENQTIYSKENLLIYFMELLNLSSHDIILLDRSTEIGPQVIRAKGEAKVGVIIHAEHFNEPLTSNSKILWNNYYEYQFKNASSIDFFVTATLAQKELLKEQFLRYKNENINIYTIPVGSLDELKIKQSRKNNSLITASRLASEKHLDWLVRAVCKAREEIKDLTLDIYGRGGEASMINNLINKLDAQSYIRLMGQKDLNEVYKEYTTYVSASTSEGFGLTLMEAVGSGLGMIGFDVRYGNPTFIQEDRNGYLVKYFRNNDIANVDNLAKAIIKIQNKEAQNIYEVQASSYLIADRFLTENIQKLWINLEKEIIND